MTSTAGTDPHPEVTEISDFSEGLLPRERAAAVEDHVAGCDVCADVLSSLEEIRGLLGTLPGPARMPADVAGRIDAAIAAEAVLDAARHDVPRGTPPREPLAPDTGTDVPRGTSSGPADPPSHPRGTAAGGTSPSGPAGPAGPGRSGPGRRGRGAPPGSAGNDRRRSRRLLAAAYAVTALALGGLVYGVTYSSPGDTSASSSTADSAKRDSAAGTSASLDAKVHQLLAGKSAQPQAGGGATPSLTGHGNLPMTGRTSDHPDLAAPPASAVPSCVLKATHRSQGPLAAGRETYQGSLAYLLVLPHPGDTSYVDAFLVSASCTSTSPGAVLFQGTYSR